MHFNLHSYCVHVNCWRQTEIPIGTPLLGNKKAYKQLIDLGRFNNLYIFHDLKPYTFYRAKQILIVLYYVIFHDPKPYIFYRAKQILIVLYYVIFHDPKPYTFYRAKQILIVLYYIYLIFYVPIFVVLWLSGIAYLLFLHLFYRSAYFIACGFCWVMNRNLALLWKFNFLSPSYFLVR